MAPALDLRVCIEPHETTRRGEFRGHYVAGFETSSFTPCGTLPEFSDQHRGTAYEGLIGPPIWVEFAPGVYEHGPAWPSSKDQSYPRRYVRWRGALTGPGAHGHMGAAFYELRVEQILEVRPARESDCR